MRINDAVNPTEAFELIKQATQTDGVPPLSEQFLRGLNEADLFHTHKSVYVDDNLAALAANDGASTELVVHPAYRRRGIATALLAEEKAVWAHGDLPAAKKLMSTLGWEPTRELLVMGISGTELAAAAHFEGELASLNLEEAADKWGRDFVLQAWLQANNQAFSWHPEQGGWDQPRLARAMSANWFNATDVLFLWDGNNLAGFHWTKRHTTELGEVYVVGLADAYRGKGLGDPLVRLGLEHLHNLGAKRVILYVEADNHAAVKAYEKLGFSVAERHVLYVRTP